MRKIKIAFASILKPVDETRMYEKMGLSLDQTNKYEINIIGFSTKNVSTPETVNWHPIYNHARLSIKRLAAPFKCFKILVKVKPQVIIFNTPELLIVITTYKILFGGKIVYDILENYLHNILYTNTYPHLIRPLLARLVRGLEWICRPAIDHYFLAEKRYATELGFTKNKSTIIENKFKGKGRPSPKTKVSNDNIALLYSGTIAENYGILEAIHFAEKLHELRKTTSLTIMGYCAKPALLRRIKQRIKDKPYIRLVGGDRPVPHTRILEAIEKADLGLVPYRANKSTDNCMPTKIYEYMACRLPMIMQNNPYWIDFCQPHHACIPVNFLSFDASKVMDRYYATTFYNSDKPMDIYWEKEEMKLFKVLDRLVGSH
ncbi:MAG: glycosyltransferase [Cytophagales bacterium]|nr:glycosyltransferase [Cytophagales bacterium]